MSDSVYRIPQRNIRLEGLGQVLADEVVRTAEAFMTRWPSITDDFLDFRTADLGPTTLAKVGESDSPIGWSVWFNAGLSNTLRNMAVTEARAFARSLTVHELVHDRHGTMTMGGRIFSMVPPLTDGLGISEDGLNGATLDHSRGDEQWTPEQLKVRQMIRDEFGPKHTAVDEFGELLAYSVQQSMRHRHPGPLVRTVTSAFEHAVKECDSVIRDEFDTETSERYRTCEYDPEAALARRLDIVRHLRATNADRTAYDIATSVDGAHDWPTSERTAAVARDAAQRFEPRTRTNEDLHSIARSRMTVPELSYRAAEVDGAFDASQSGPWAETYLLREAFWRDSLLGRGLTVPSIHANGLTRGHQVETDTGGNPPDPRSSAKATQVHSDPSAVAGASQRSVPARSSVDHAISAPISTPAGAPEQTDDATGVANTKAGPASPASLAQSPSSEAGSRPKPVPPTSEARVSRNPPRAKPVVLPIDASQPSPHADTTAQGARSDDETTPDASRRPSVSSPPVARPVAPSSATGDRGVSPRPGATRSTPGGAGMPGIGG